MRDEKVAFSQYVILRECSDRRILAGITKLLIIFILRHCIEFEVEVKVHFVNHWNFATIT